MRQAPGRRYGPDLRGSPSSSYSLVERLWEALEARPGLELAVDLIGRTVTAGDDVYAFTIDDYTRHRLLEGLDDIALTLQHVDDIEAYEARRPAWLPRTLPARTAKLRGGSPRWAISHIRK